MTAPACISFVAVPPLNLPLKRSTFQTKTYFWKSPWFIILNICNRTQWNIIVPNVIFLLLVRSLEIAYLQYIKTRHTIIKFIYCKKSRIFVYSWKRQGFNILLIFTTATKVILSFMLWPLNIVEDGERKSHYFQLLLLSLHIWKKFAAAPNRMFAQISHYEHFFQSLGLQIRINVVTSEWCIRQYALRQTHYVTRDEKL